MKDDVSNTIRPWGGAGVFVVIMTIVVGITYIIYQWISQANAEDPLFVGILMANTYAIYRFTMFLKKHLSASAVDYKNALVNSSASFDEDRFIQEVFNKRNAFVTGLLFGAIFFFTSLNLSPWGAGSPFNTLLGVFLFSSNILTGMALYGLYVYFRYSLLIGSNIEVDLWDRSSPAISALVDTNRYVVLATAFVACTGMMSIIFSKFTLDYSIIVYSVFSITIILLAYIIPLIPITAQIRKKKKKSMSEISLLIQNEYAALLKAGKDAKLSLDTSKFDSLVSVHKSVKGVKAFPPVGEQSINTAMSVAFLTMLPSIIDFVLNRVTG